MNHVQAVAVSEASHPDNNNNNDKHNLALRRNIVKDSNNNNTVTKESLNVKKQTDDVEYPEGEYGFWKIKFKSPIKWLNSVSIILIHVIFLFAFLTYPVKAAHKTSLWGKFYNYYPYLNISDPNK